ncbi:hypothetical protein EDC32_103669 [Laceyella sacchari]|nr:hypothetical protein EDC32_103669 [Laceyella sacchari]
MQQVVVVAGSFKPTPHMVRQRFYFLQLFPERSLGCFVYFVFSAFSLSYAQPFDVIKQGDHFTLLLRCFNRLVCRSVLFTI